MRKGYNIITRNYRSLFGEIDIVAFDPEEKILVFVEVRARKKDSLVNPLETVDRKKAERIKKTALKFLQDFKGKFEGIRFDVIGIEAEKDNKKIVHVKNALEF